VEIAVRGGDGYVYTMGLARGDRSGTYVKRNFAVCSAIAAPSVSANAFASGRVYLDANGAALVGDADGTSRSYGGRLLSNPDVENVGGAVLAGTGGDRQIWVLDSRPGALGNWVAMGGQFR
jgi:hypothetical protein